MLRRPAACAAAVAVAALAGWAPRAAAQSPARTAAAFWSLRQVGLPSAWRLAAPHRAVVVAVLDSGLDPADPVLAGSTVAGADFVGGGATTDDFGHGTLVAGLIAGRDGVGACPGCRVMPVRVIDSAGHATAAAIAAGIAWAVAHGAAVVNMSFAMPTADPGIEAAVADALRRGVILVAASGNGGPGAPVYPAAYPGVLSVAATDANDRVEPWSGRGAWVDVAAPGCSSSVAVGGGRTEFCGTSSATALVSGVVALALSTSDGLDGASVVRVLEQTAAAVAGVSAGRVDAAGLLRTIAPALALAPGAAG